MPKKGEMVDIVLYDKKNDKNKIIDSYFLLELAVREYVAVAKLQK